MSGTADSLAPMVQRGHVDIGALSSRAPVLLSLSAPQARPWAGVYALAPSEPLVLADRARHDIYVLEGELIEQELTHPAGSFVSRGQAMTLRAGPAGTSLFMYRDELARKSGHETWRPDELVWHAGTVPGMTVSPLAETHHWLALVRWRPGTRTPTHRHPRGEEIFVLDGELRDDEGVYPAGTWLRYAPGTGHAPFAEQETLILLRNGHLFS